MTDIGILNINKEKGYTSHDVVAIVRRTLNRIKTGHTGTLDPYAEGVLPICVGKATRLSSYLTEEGKTYIAEVILGITTDTGDQTGNVLTTAPVTYDTAVIENAAAFFVGTYKQTPPMYSAIKVNGQKLYNLARKGMTVERPSRTVSINKLTITAFTPERNAFTIEVDCSKGTYIRALCADIGERLGCGACMGDLVRTRSGLFTITDAIRLDEFKHVVEDGRADAFFWPVERALPYPRIFLLADGVKLAVNGNPVPLAYVADADMLRQNGKVWLYDGNRLIGLFIVQYIETTEGRLIPEVMLI